MTKKIHKQIVIDEKFQKKIDAQRKKEGFGISEETFFLSLLIERGLKK
jgi:hypothetical protein